MIDENNLNDQDILAYFTRPTRSINHGRIKEIRSGEKHKNVAPASSEELENFRASWPQIDVSTGLHIRGDELLIKSREAMLHAVQSYNTPKTYFKSEIFIVTAVIAWTYLLHWHYKQIGVDYRHMKKGTNEPLKTKHGADKHWELEACLDSDKCPLDQATRSNLKFIIEIRHEIEHQMTQRIDSSISAKLQACCLNFNAYYKKLVGDRYGLEADIGVALQFSTIEIEQRNILLKETDLPKNFLAAQQEFEGSIEDSILSDSRYSYRVALIQKTANTRGKADQLVEFVKAGTTEGQDIQRILLKETEKKKYKPKEIVKILRSEGYKKFSMQDHTELWQTLDARNPKHAYGVFLRDKDWWWYENWLERARLFCSENVDRFK